MVGDGTFNPLAKISSARIAPPKTTLTSGPAKTMAAR
jgi:hypothetical protein